MSNRNLIKIEFTEMEIDLIIEALGHAYAYTEDGIFQKLEKTIITIRRKDAKEIS